MKDKNTRDLEEQYNKYIYPKPCDDIEKEFSEKNRYLMPDPNYMWHKLWPEKPYSSKKLNILVAGCGSDQAAILAKCNPNHDFVGVDISKNSLAHQEKLINKHKIKNLDLYCKDFRLLKFQDKFDYIICTGVIHHLDDPGSALNYLNKNLEKDGAIYLMVYGDKRSYAANELKKIFSKTNLQQNQESIDAVKNLLYKLDIKHPAKIFAQGLKDINYNAGVVDLFLHKKETFFSIKKLISLLLKNNLIIKNFINKKIKSFSKYFIDNKLILNKLKKLPLEDQWELAQILNWDDRLIEVVCSKKKNLKKSIAYKTIDLDDIYTYRYQNTVYNIDNQNISIIDRQTNEKFDLKLPINLKVDWEKILKGKIKLKDILKDFNEKDKTILKNRINFMIESCLLDISFHPIANYRDYYNKKTN